MLLFFIIISILDEDKLGTPRPPLSKKHARHAYPENVKDVKKGKSSIKGVTIPRKSIFKSVHFYIALGFLFFALKITLKKKRLHLKGAILKRGS